MFVKMRSHWTRVSLKPNVTVALTRQEKTLRDPEGRQPCAEGGIIGLMRLQNKECQILPATRQGRAKKGSLPEPSKEAWPGWTPWS